MNQAEAEAISAFQERLLDLHEAAPRPQIPDVLVHPHCHMHGKTPHEHRPPQMRHTGLAILRRPAHSTPTPLSSKAERQLLPPPPSCLLHTYLAYIAQAIYESLKCTF